MKKPPAAVSVVVLSPSPRKLASVILLAMATAAQAEIVVNESFTGYTTGTTNLLGQAATGTGLTGNWGGSQFYRVQDTSLTMTGVASSGGSLYFPHSTTTGNNLRTAFAAFTSPLSTDTTYYGSYLFSFSSAGTTGRTVGAVGVGSSTDIDNTASFVWAGNGYNSSTTIEGPNIRAEGTQTSIPTLSLTVNTTYIMLFEFNAASSTTSAWVLNQNQLTTFFGSLNAATLNAATMNTEDPTGIVWGGTITGSSIGEMSNLILFGSISTDASYVYQWDEIRLSDTSLTEAVTAVPEPSTIATLGLGLGTFAAGRLLRRRRQA